MLRDAGIAMSRRETDCLDPVSDTRRHIDLVAYTGLRVIVRRGGPAAYTNLAGRPRKSGELYSHHSPSLAMNYDGASTEGRQSVDSKFRFPTADLHLEICPMSSVAFLHTSESLVRWPRPVSDLWEIRH